MSKVNSEVQQAADSTIYIWQAILDLWAMIPIELKMYLAVMYITSAVLQYYKTARLRDYYKAERAVRIKLASMPISIITAIGAAFVYKEKIHYGWFIFAGITASFTVRWVHYILVDIVYPFIKKIPSMRLAIKGKDQNG